ncbi:NAD(P)-binding protein [Hypomontagnella monticulosa]|nr:NAD(P)-binding protein [Hypomontagnella monticulosa]
MATKSVSFNPVTDIPSLEGKVILITGANSGLGKQSSLELARHNPEQIWMAARSPEKGNEAVTDIKRQVPGAAVTLLVLDLSSFDSIKSAAKTVLASSPRLDILMLNAGLMGCPPKHTKEGYEIQMGTNHVGHALLLKLLTPLLLKTVTSHPVRIVSLASSGWKYAGPEKIQFETLKSLEGVSPVNRYIQSKAANMLYAQEFAKHYPQLTIVSVDPGEVATQLFSREPGDEQMVHLQTEVAPKRVRPVEEGVKNQLWAATAREVTSGLHYEPVGVHKPSGLMLDKELAKKVWDWTQRDLEGQEI